MNSSTERKQSIQDGPEQKKYVVAHLDVLGAKEKMISQNESVPFLQALQKLYDEPVKYIEAENKANNSLKLKDLEIRIFSDNIVIAQECKQHSFLAELYEVINRSAFMQAIALEQGIFIRGAITHGDFYIDKTFVYGKALVDAYKLETERAKYPRIIVDESVFADTLYPLHMQRATYGKFLRKDFDGEYFLNFANKDIDRTDADLQYLFDGFNTLKINMRLNDMVTILLENDLPDNYNV